MNPKVTKLTDHIRIVAMGRSTKGRFFLRLRVAMGGTIRRHVVSLDALGKDLSEVNAEFNLFLQSPKARGEFQNRVQDARDLRSSFRVVTTPGWHGRSFVLPTGEVIGAANWSVCLDANARKAASSFRCGGNMKGWRRIAQLACGNSRTMLALAVAAAGPIIDLLGVEPPGFQFIGDPGSGKTTHLRAAISFYGDRGSSWNNTAANLEPLAAARTGTLLALNEAHLARGDGHRPYRGLLDAVFRLFEGEGRGRLTDVTDQLRWSLGLLSSSNKSVDEMGADAGIDVDDAARTRLTDVTPASTAGGAFENLNGMVDHSAFGARINELTRRHHGWAARVHIDEIVEWRRRSDAGFNRWMRQRHDYFVGFIKTRVGSPDRDLGRIYGSAATAYVGGALAIRFGLFPWTLSELRDAIVACIRAHVDLVAGMPVPQEATKRSPAAIPGDPWPLLAAHVRDKLSELITLTKPLAELPRQTQHDDRAGYLNRRRDGRLEFLIAVPKLKQVVGGGKMLKRLRSDRARSGWIYRDDARFSVKRSIGKGSRLQVMAFDYKKLRALVQEAPRKVGACKPGLVGRDDRPKRQGARR